MMQLRRRGLSAVPTHTGPPMNTPALVRRIGRLEILLCLTAVALLVAAFSPSARTRAATAAVLDPVTTRVLRVVDASGRPRGGLCFDYTTAEAMCLTKAPRLGFVGLTMFDRPAPG